MEFVLVRLCHQYVSLSLHKSNIRVREKHCPKIAFRENKDENRAYLEIAKLGKQLSTFFSGTIFKLAWIWFCLAMNGFVLANISSLREPFPTQVTRIWSFAGVSTLMCLVKMC